MNIPTTCHECDGYGELCGECFLPEEYCGCSSDLEFLVSCYNCDGLGEINDEW